MDEDIQRLAARIWNYIRDAEDGYYREVAYVSEMIKQFLEDMNE